MGTKGRIIYLTKFAIKGMCGKLPSQQRKPVQGTIKRYLIFGAANADDLPSGYDGNDNFAVICKRFVRVGVVIYRKI